MLSAWDLSAPADGKCSLRSVMGGAHCRPCCARCVTRRATLGLASGVPIATVGLPCTSSQVGYPQLTRVCGEGQSKALPSRARCVSALYAVAIGVWDKLWKKLFRTSFTGLGLVDRPKTRANCRSRNSPGADTLVRSGLEIHKSLALPGNRACVAHNTRRSVD